MRGRKLKNDCKEVSNISISIPKNKQHLAQAMRKIIDMDLIKDASVSKLMVDATEIYLGQVNTSMLENVITDKYAEREIVGPKLFNCFNDILCWELRNKPLPDIAKLWNINHSQLAFILYKHLKNI